MRKNSVKNRKINDEVRRVLAQIISGGITAGSKIPASAP